MPELTEQHTSTLKSVTQRRATSHTPQIAIVVADDSGSMDEPVAPGGMKKAEVVDAFVKNLIDEAVAANAAGRRYRYLLSIGAFGSAVHPVCVAESPREIAYDFMKKYFTGKSGGTAFGPALEWAATALGESLAKARREADFNEANSPPPIVLFLSDGENTDKETDVAALAARLKATRFAGEPIAVLALCVGLKAEHRATMQSIASRPEYVFDVEPNQLESWLAEAGKTILRPEDWYV